MIFTEGTNKMNKKELINEHKELVKSLNLNQVMTLFHDNDLKDDFEKILFNMPKLASLEQLRETLVLNLIDWINYDELNEEQLNVAINQVKSYKENK